MHSETQTTPESATSQLQEPWYGEVPATLRNLVEPATRCSKCDYSLNGLPAGRPCPECGSAEAYGGLEFTVSIDRQRALIGAWVLALITIAVLSGMVLMAYRVGRPSSFLPLIGVLISLFSLGRFHFIHAIWPGRCVINSKEIVVCVGKHRERRPWRKITSVRGKTGWHRFSHIDVGIGRIAGFKVGNTRIYFDGDAEQVEALAAFMRQCQDRLVATGEIPPVKRTWD